MRLLRFFYLSLIFVATSASVNALVVTNGVWAGTNTPTNPGWFYNIRQGTVIGYRVVASVKHIDLGSGMQYLGTNYRLIKKVDVFSEDIRFYITEKPLPSWATVATNAWTEGMIPEFPVFIVANGVGCASIDGVNCHLYDGSWRWGDKYAKRWGYGMATCTRGKLWWHLGTAMAGAGDSGNSVFNEKGEFLAPISSGVGAIFTNSWSGGSLVRPWLHLVAEYMAPPPPTNAPAPPRQITNVIIKPLP